MDMNNMNYVNAPNPNYRPPRKIMSFGARVIMACIISCILSGIIGAVTATIIYRHSPDLGNKTVKNVTEEVVTITDEGIAKSVTKVIDSVVVVKTYLRESIISTGTGFVYKYENGKFYVLTNYHVIQNGDSVHLLFTTGDEVTAVVSGGDRFADIAVLEFVSAFNIPVAEIGSSVDSEVGDTVFAIGAPLDSDVYSWSVSRGVLSGKDRKVEVSTSHTNTSDWIMDVLQTDAAINSGNSGGPLCNVNGQVIGITNMKLINSGVEGIGFAIPIEEGINYANALLSGEDVSRPYIGISMIDASNRTSANRYNVEPQKAVIVQDVGIDSPAYKAGLKVGDVIIAINGDKVENVASLRYMLYKYKAGDTITITYIRDGNEKETKLTLVRTS